MRKLLPVFVIFLLLSVTRLNAQAPPPSSFTFGCTRDTSVDCSQTCITLNGLIPDVHAFADDYTVSKVLATDGASGCFPASAPLDAPGTSSNLVEDDVYTDLTLMPFIFPFYGYYSDQVAISTNGLISFDMNMSGAFSDWQITGDLPSADYDRAVIMGPFHDIDIRQTTSVLRQVKVDYTGVAPHRKWSLTFYKVPCFSCINKINNSYQITLYEGLGIIDIYIKDREVCPGWNQGKAIVGIQNYDRDKALMAPGRAASDDWGSLNMNETWRFTPKEGASLFKKVELVDLTGNVVAVGDTSGRTANNNLKVSFNNVCPTSTTQYIVKSTYYHFLYFLDPSSWPTTDKDSLIYGTDTVTIFKNGSIPAIDVTTANAQCGANPNGTITVTSPASANYEYSIDGGSHYQPYPNNSFSVPPGTYTVTIHDVTGSCTKDTTVTITGSSTLTASAVTTVKASCPGASNATITLTASLGSGTYTYAIDGGSTPVYNNATGVFTGQTDGSHTLYVKDGAGCVFSLTHTVDANPVFTTTATATNSSCLGALNGSLSVTQPTTGQTPYNYSIPVGSSNSYQSSGNFTGLAGDSTYTINVKDGAGCVYTFDQYVDYDAGVTASVIIRNASCTGVDNGHIVLNPSGGTSPYFIQIDTSALVEPFIVNDTIRKLGQGLYDVTIKDNLGCLLKIDDIPVTAGTGVRATYNPIKSSCFAASNGGIEVTVTPFTGIAPFQYSLNSNPYQLLPDTIKNLTAGNYLLTIKDAAGCTYTFPPVSVGSNDPGISATVTTKATACFTATTGQIFIAPTSGVGPFTYSLDNAAAVTLTDTLRGLDSGFHRIVLTDALGCNITLNEEVTFGTGVSATATPKATACATATTGQIFIAPIAGIGSFTYSIDNLPFVALNDTIRNLDSGIHVIVVKDAVGCTKTLNPDVPIGPGVSATATPKATACATATTGQIFVQATAGVGSFTYSIDNLPFVALNDTIRNLDSGIHVIVVKDAVGCIKTLNPDVLIGPGVSATATPKATACATATTGQIFVQATAGVGSFTYSIDNLPFVALNDTIRNLDSGIHVIVVKDAVGCTKTLNPDVLIGPGVSATTTLKSTECATATTGQIFVAPTAGIAPFTFDLDNAGSFLPLNDTLRNLGAGAHRIELKDAIGCTIILNPQVPVGAGVTATARSVNSACLGVSTGQIIVTPTAGTAPFTYTIGSSGSLSLDTIRNIASGNYNIVLSDAVGCSFNVPPVTVNDNIGVTAAFSIVNSACAGAATGAIIVKPLTGTRNYDYSIDGGANYQTDSVFRKLAANAYNIRIKDLVGCVLNSAAQNVGNNVGVVTNASTIKNASCASIPNGSIAVNVTAGILPLTYEQISPAGTGPQSGNQFPTLFPGPYDLKITDSAGCTKTITSIVGSDPKVQFDSLNIVRPTCNGLKNGTIKVNVSLGVAPYEYAIDNPSLYGSSKDFSLVGAGVHKLYVRDANLCAIDTTFTITEPTVLDASITSTTPATCSGAPDGKIIATASGGTLPYEYALDNTTTIGYQDISLFDVLKGSYRVVVRDAMGCTDIAPATVDSVFTMYLDLGADTTVCAEQSIALTPVTNPETSIFTYSPSSSLDDPNVKNPKAMPLAPTRYKLSATWGICTLTDEVYVDVKRKPVPNAGEGVIICFDTTTELKASASNLSGTVNYTWSPASLLDTKADTTDVIARPKEQFTYYTVTVTDNYNCGYAVKDSVLVNMLPEVYAFAGNDTNAVLNAPHQLTATGAGIGGSYIWDAPPAGVTISDLGMANPIATFTPVPQPGTFHPDTNYYRLSVLATNAAGCQAWDTIKINVFIGPTSYVPTAFSPNNDGVNDIFRAVPVGINLQYFRVFNRYGEAVFETSRFMQGWDGTYKGKPQAVGAYAWVLKGKDRKGREVVMKGTVMLVR